VTAVSGNFFDELGVPILLGRGFTSGEDRVPGRDAVTVLSYGLWQQLFSGDPDVVGRQMSIGNHVFTVVGVTDKSYTGMYQRDIPDESFVPLAMEREVFRIAGRDPRADRMLRTATVKARLRRGVSPDEARSEMRIIAGELARTYPGTNKGQDILVQTEFQARISSGQLEAGVLLILNILAAAVLCVACANVAGLLTSRAPLRHRELAVRLAVGAGRGRLIAQLFTESVLLAILGGLGGLAVGEAGIRLLRRIEIPTDLIGPPAFVMDNRALGFSVAVAVVSALLFGLGPALSTTRIEPVVLDARDGSRHAPAVDAGRPQHPHGAASGVVADGADDRGDRLPDVRGDVRARPRFPHDEHGQGQRRRRADRLRGLARHGALRPDRDVYAPAARRPVGGCHVGDAAPWSRAHAGHLRSLEDDGGRGRRDPVRQRRERRLFRDDGGWCAGGEGLPGH
jgi:hypothetical protein